MPARRSAPRWSAPPQYDAYAHSAAERDLDRRNDAPGGSPLDAEQNQQFPPSVPAAVVPKAEPRAAIDAARALAERIEQEARGGVEPLEALPGVTARDDTS